MRTSKIIFSLFLIISLQICPTFMQLEASSPLTLTQEVLENILSSSSEEREQTHIQKNTTRLLYKVKRRMHGHVCGTLEIAPREILVKEMLDIFDLAASDFIQFKDEVKLDLIRLGTFLFELVVYETSLLKRNLYKETLTKISELLTKLSSTLPATNIEARFYLTCSHQLLKLLQINPSAYLKEVFQEARSISIENLLKLIPRIHKNKIKHWYISYYTLNWLTLDVHDLDSFSRHLKQPVEKILRKPKIDKDYVIGCCLILIDLMQRESEDVDPFLKQKILGNYLYQLIDHSSWEVRYIVIEFMLQWLENENQNGKVILQKILKQAAVEKNNDVKSLTHRFMD